MKCEEAEELLGAYALEALPEDEMAAVRAHLSGCPEHAAKALELRAVALSLEATVDNAAPPAGLRDRITAAVAAQGSREVESPPLLQYRASTPESIAEQRARRRWFVAPPPVWGAIAAALVIGIAALFAWNIALQSDNGSPAVVAVRPLLQGTGATSGYAVMFDDGTMSVRGDALPRLDAAQTYQLWSLAGDGEARSLGVMDYDEAGAAIANGIEFDDDDARAVAITIEPAGGSEQPTSDPLYVAEI